MADERLSFHAVPGYTQIYVADGAGGRNLYVCGECAALVENTSIHDAWHARTDKRSAEN